MSDRSSLTTVWVCECGYKNSIANRFCPKCGHSLPESVSKGIYKEEILIQKENRKNSRILGLISKIKNKNKWLLITVSIVIVAVIIIVVSGINRTNTISVSESKMESTSVRNGPQESSKRNGPQESSKVDGTQQNTDLISIPYEELLRNPEKYIGTTLEYSAEAKSVYYSQDGSLSFFIYQDENMVSCEMKDTSRMPQRLLEGDQITVTGTFEGVEAWIGSNDHIELNVVDLKFEDIKTFEASAEPSYEQLLRNPEKYIGTTLKYSAEAKSVYYSQDGSLSFFIYQDGNMVSCEMKDTSRMPQRLLEGDRITVTGTFEGVEAWIGSKDHIELNVVDLKFEDIKTFEASAEPSYEQLLRNPEKYIGTTLKYSAEAKSVYYSQDGSLSFFIYQDGNMVSCEMKDTSRMPQRLLEGDRITVTGTFEGVEAWIGSNDHIVLNVTDLKFN